MAEIILQCARENADDQLPTCNDNHNQLQSLPISGKGRG